MLRIWKVKSLCSCPRRRVIEPSAFVWDSRPHAHRCWPLHCEFVCHHFRLAVRLFRILLKILLPEVDKGHLALLKGCDDWPIRKWHFLFPRRQKVSKSSFRILEQLKRPSAVISRCSHHFAFTAASHSDPLQCNFSSILRLSLKVHLKIVVLPFGHRRCLDLKSWGSSEPKPL